MESSRVATLTTDTKTIPNPSWVDVEREIIALDGRQQTLVMLSPAAPKGAPDGDHHMAIGGPGKLLLGEKGFNDLVLWRDTAPDETVFVCRARKTVELMVWNCWRDDRGVMQAWIGNAGMRLLETSSNTVRVECNSRPEVTFSDLVFDLIFEEP